MMIGHTGQNWALRFLPAHAVNLTLLGEPVGATLIAFLLPVVLVGLTLVGLVSGRQILKAWRITVFLVCLFAAMAAPGGDAHRGCGCLHHGRPASPQLLPGRVQAVGSGTAFPTVGDHVREGDVMHFRFNV